MSIISQNNRTAIVLLNLGGPDAPQSVRPFLFNLFNDPLIFRMPAFVRRPLAAFVSWRRDKKAQAIYAHMGGKSPLLEGTNAQADSLQESLKSLGNVKVFTCMRYWHPMSAEVVANVKDYAPDHIILLPLYPQYSTTTTLSSFRDWYTAAKRAELHTPTTEICCYFTEPTFLASHAALIKEAMFEASAQGAPRVLYSAHGLPENIVKSGDPYQWQVEQTVARLNAILGLNPAEAYATYQSRVGPLKWIGPSTEDEIRKAGSEKKPLVIVPIAFVSEHSETLVELDIEYREIADHAGVPHYSRVPALGVHSDYIQTLQTLCLQVEAQTRRVSPPLAMRCPETFSECRCRTKELA
ncbi:MAG: ferrochelatase [Rickettsiales bacterium]|nr:ferrochelatase [Rickettsiales bacterium]